MDTVPQKVCSRCEQTKPIDQFVRNNRSQTGYGSHCKSCHVTYYHQSVASPEGRERERTRLREYYRTNEEARIRNRTATNRRHSIRWESDPLYRARKMNYKKQGYKIKPEWRKVRNAWQRQNNKKPEVMAKRLVLWHRRRSRIDASEEHFTHEEWIELCDRYGHVCLACGQSVRLTPDHVIPLALLGSNGIDNIQPLCLPCNIAKGIKTTDYRY